MMHVSEDICSTFRGREQDFYEKAFLNILSDFADDRIHMQHMQRAVLNILDDFHADGVQLRDIQSAVINILEDSAAEKIQLERTQRAVLNILDDVESERKERKQAEERVRALNEELEARVLQRTAALSAANQELESFAYSVSHDLRAPLRAIDGFSKILLEDYGTVVDDEGKDALNRVRAAAQRMGLLIDDMLKLSRSTRGDIELEVIDLSAMAKTIIGRLSAAAPRETMQVSIAEGIAAMGDPRLLDAVLENLLSNAWKFTGKTALPTISFSAVARLRNGVPHRRQRRWL